LKRVREADVAAAVADYLTVRGYDIVQEFPMLGRLFDIYGLRAADGLAITVECKERDWRRAAAQARVGRVVSSVAYVAMPAAQVSTAAQAFLQAEGLGLLVVTGDLEVQERFSPAASNRSVAVLRERALERFEQLSRGAAAQV